MFHVAFIRWNAAKSRAVKLLNNGAEMFDIELNFEYFELTAPSNGNWSSRIQNSHKPVFIKTPDNCSMLLSEGGPPSSQAAKLLHNRAEIYLILNLFRIF